MINIILKYLIKILKYFRDSNSSDKIKANTIINKEQNIKEHYINIILPRVNSLKSNCTYSRQNKNSCIIDSWIDSCDNLLVLEKYNKNREIEDIIISLPNDDNEIFAMLSYMNNQTFFDWIEYKSNYQKDMINFLDRFNKNAPYTHSNKFK